MTIYEESLKLLADLETEFSVEARKIVLYGSVARDEAREDSDIDVAIILMDDMRFLPKETFEDIPYGFSDRLQKRTSSYDSHRPHVVFYWEDEFRRGIELDDGRNPFPNLLNNVCKVFYDDNLEL